MGRLYGSRIYCAGPIERAKDFGHGWRNWITPLLEEKGIIVLNPLKKPLLSWEESDECMLQRRQWRHQEQYDKLVLLRRIRSTDLRLVDISDFLIVYLDMSAKPFGTIEEMVTANRQKKMCLTVVEGGFENSPDWLWWMLDKEQIHSSWESLLDYVDDIDSGRKDHKRFIHFDYKRLSPKK